MAGKETISNMYDPDLDLDLHFTTLYPIPFMAIPVCIIKIHKIDPLSLISNKICSMLAERTHMYMNDFDLVLDLELSIYNGFHCPL